MAETRFGSYVLEKRVAVGGMAEVYEAKRIGPEGFEKKVAIKRILPRFDQRPEWRGLFTREAQIAAELNHPNIVQIFDFGELEDSYFIAMEFVHGVNLTKLISRQQKRKIKMPRLHSNFVVREVLQALHYAHSRRGADGAPNPIVHRDVSPSNVMISFEGKVKLTDFGIAKALGRDDSGTIPGAFKGKYLYAAPEQLLGTGVDIRTDLYSTGVLLYLLLANRRPFESAVPDEVLKLQEKEKYPSLRLIDPKLTEDLSEIVTRALRADPNDRFQRAADFMAALSPLLGSLPSHEMEEKLTSWLRRIVADDIGAKPRSDEEIRAITEPEMRAPEISELEAEKRPFISKTFHLIWLSLVCVGLGAYFLFKPAKFERPSVTKIVPEKATARAQPPATSISTPRPAVSPMSTSPRSTWAIVKLSPTVAPTQKPTPPPKVARPAVQMGTLIVFPDGPFANVTLDGKKVGDTPIMGFRVSAGKHKIVFENPSLNLKREMEIRIQPGKELRLTRIWEERAE